MRKIKIFIRAVFKDYWYWRVTYPNGERTRLLSYGEASSLQNVYGGKLWIDYNIKLNP